MLLKEWGIIALKMDQNTNFALIFSNVDMRTNFNILNYLIIFSFSMAYECKLVDANIFRKPMAEFIQKK
jgi:hypothetical protein